MSSEAQHWQETADTGRLFLPHSTMGLLTSDTSEVNLKTGIKVYFNLSVLALLNLMEQIFPI